MLPSYINMFILQFEKKENLSDKLIKLREKIGFLLQIIRDPLRTGIKGGWVFDRGGIRFHQRA